MKIFFILNSSSKVHYIIELYYTFTLIFSQPQKVVINIFHITHIGDLVWAGESDRTLFIDRTEYYNLSWFV